MNVVKGMNYITTNIRASPSQLHLEFKNNHILWAAIQFVITELDLIVKCTWVKAHDNNAPDSYNNEADKLAKEGNTENILNSIPNFYLLLITFSYSLVY